jgi:hypothetical protein
LAVGATAIVAAYSAPGHATVLADIISAIGASVLAPEDVTMAAGAREDEGGQEEGEEEVEMHNG